MDLARRRPALLVAAAALMIAADAFRMALLSLAMLAGVGAAPAYANEWILIAEGSNGIKFYFDKSSQVRTGNLVKVWTKTDYRGRVLSESEKNSVNMAKQLRERGLLSSNGSFSMLNSQPTVDEIAERKDFYVFDCVDRRYASVRQLTYNIEGVVVGNADESSTKPKMILIVPETVAETMLNTACNPRP